MLCIESTTKPFARLKGLRSVTIDNPCTHFNECNIKILYFLPLIVQLQLLFAKSIRNESPTCFSDMAFNI